MYPLQRSLVGNCKKTPSRSASVYPGLRRRRARFPSSLRATRRRQPPPAAIERTGKNGNPLRSPASPSPFPTTEGLKAFLRMKTMLEPTRPQHRPWTPASSTDFPSPFNNRSPCCFTLPLRPKHKSYSLLVGTSRRGFWISFEPNTALQRNIKLHKDRKNKTDPAWPIIFSGSLFDSVRETALPPSTEIHTFASRAFI